MTDSAHRRSPQRVDCSLDRLIAVTRRLVAVASPNPPSDTEEIAAVAEELLREIPGIEVERHRAGAAGEEPGRPHPRPAGPAGG